MMQPPRRTLVRGRFDQEFVERCPWPPGIHFEDSPEAARPEPRLGFLSRRTSFGDDNSLLGNSSILCLNSPFADIS
jgi:hypothetical protein